MSRKTLLTLFAAVLLTGCGTFLPMEDEQNSTLVAQAEALQVYRLSEPSSLPKIVRTLGPVEGHSCKNKPWDPLSEKAALRQLKLRALDLGANGIVELRFDRAGTELATNCWASVTASAVAVVFAPHN